MARDPRLAGDRFDELAEILLTVYRDPHEWESLLGPLELDGEIGGGNRDAQIRRLLTWLGQRPTKLDAFLKAMDKNLSGEHPHASRPAFQRWQRRATQVAELGEALAALRDNCDLLGQSRADDEIVHMATNIRAHTLAVIDKIRDGLEMDRWNVPGPRHVATARRSVLAACLRVVSGADCVLAATERTAARPLPRTSDTGPSSFVTDQAIYRVVLDERDTLILDLDVLLELIPAKILVGSPAVTAPPAVENPPATAG